MTTQTFTQLESDLLASTGLERVVLLNEIALRIHTDDPVRSAELANEALLLATDLGNLDGVAEAYKVLALVAWMRGDNRNALRLVAESAEIFSRVDNKQGTAAALNTLGLIYNSLTQYRLALSAYLQALPLLEELQYPRGLLHVHNNIGQLYLHRSELENASYHFSHALRWAENSDDPLGVGEAHVGLGEVAFLTGDLDNALVYFKRALNVPGVSAGSRHAALCMDNIGRIHANRNNYRTALEHQQKALEIRTALTYKPGIIASCLHLGEIAVALNERKPAHAWFHKALALAEETGNLRDQAAAHEKLADWFETAEKPVDALIHYKTRTALLESLFNGEKARQIAELRADYEADRRDRERETLQLRADELESRVQERTNELAEAVQRERALTHELETSLEKESAYRELQSRIIRIVSHEFRTPLTVIGNSADMLTTFHDRLTPKKRDKIRDRIKKAITQMTDLLRDVVFVDAAANDRAVVQMREMPFSDFGTALEKALLRSFDETRLQIAWDSGNDQPIELDLDLTLQLTGALVANGLKFSHAPVAVEATLADKLCIMVRDQGIGIPVDEQDQIFEMFYRASNVETQRGMGLGLYMVQLIADSLNATLSVVSAPDHGACFRAELPVSSL